MSATRASSWAIIEDDYNSEFRHTARRLEPLQRLDRDGRAIYVGTFSNTLSPALRLGLLVAPTNLIPSICVLRQVIDWCPPLATQVAFATLIAGGHLDRHLRRSRAVYRERHRLLWDALGELLPRGYRLLPAAAGLHITIVRPELPPDRSVWSLLESRGFLIGRCDAPTVSLTQHLDFWSVSGPFPHRQWLLPPERLPRHSSGSDQVPYPPADWLVGRIPIRTHRGTQAR